MGKSVIGVVLGTVIGVLAGAWLVQLQVRGSSAWAGPDLWPAVVAAELKIARGAELEGLPTLVALAEELHALRRQRALHGILRIPYWLRAAIAARPAAYKIEQHALDFMIGKVTARLDAELDQWQDRMTAVSALDPVRREAALRLLAFVKWQQKGGEYEYAYDFFEQLSRAAPPPPPPPPPRPNPPTVIVEKTPSPVPPTPTVRRKRR